MRGLSLAAPIALFAFVLWVPRPSMAETLWERAKWGARAEEKLMRQSVEKVLLGVGDERDLLQVRVGLITLSRGEVQDPRTIVLLLRLRREMGLSQSKYTEPLLKRALEGQLSLTERAWAQLEFAHHFISRRDLSGAHAALSDGLDIAWRTQVRAEIAMLRGLVHLRSGRGTEAMEDFSQVVTLGPSRRLIVQAQIGMALAFALRGDSQRVRETAREAFITEATRATVSRLDPFWDLDLSTMEHDSARALLLFGQAFVLAQEEPRDAYRARARACSLLEPSPQKPNEDAPQREQDTRIWGAEIRRSLGAYFEKTCLEPPPEEIEIAPLEDDLAPGNDENDL